MNTMFNGEDYARAWSRIGWALLVSGLLVIGLSVWFSWPTVITLIAMTVSSFGLLLRIINPLSVLPKEQISWYQVALPLMIPMMLFGMSPVLLTLAYVFGSTVLLWAAGIVAGISVMVIVAAEVIGSQVETLRDMAKMIIPRYAHTWPTESDEEDNISH